MDTTVADTILAQMGGMGRIRAFTGASAFVAREDSVSFHFPNQKGPNHIQVTLLPSDTYKVEFARISRAGSKILSSYEDIGCEQLVELFERETGLYLHF